jgi:hypothetical protein
MALVVLGICCYTACQKRAKRDRRNYYFTPLSQKLLFEGDGKEEELFRTPLTGKYVLYSMANFTVGVYSSFIDTSSAREASCLLGLFVFPPTPIIYYSLQ